MHLITSSKEAVAVAPWAANEHQSSLRTADWKRYLVPLFALALTSYFALLQVSRWPERLRYPGEEDAAEGTQLSEMVHLRRGVHVYRSPSDGEFDGAIYGPLCYLLGAAIINPAQPAYLPLRLLSLAATLGISALAGLFVFRLTRSKFGATLAPLVLFSNAYIGRYGISARADMVALLFSFAGFLVFFSYRNSRRALFVAAVLVLLSVFYKQQFIGAPAALLIYLVGTKRFSQALRFASTLALGTLLLTAGFTWLVFPHQHFLTHFFVYNRLPYDKSIILPEILMFVVPLFVPLLASADYLDTNRDMLTKAYALLAVAVYFLLLFSSGSGADTNRCLEAVVILSCLVAARIATARGLISGIAWTSALAFTLLLVAELGSAFVVPKVAEQDFAADRALQSYLHANFPSGTSALSYYPADPLRAGLDVPVTNLWHYSALIRKGVIPDRQIVERIGRGGYGVILLDFDLTVGTAGKTGDFYTTRPMREAILGSYREQAQLELPTPEVTRFSTKTLHVWVPRGGSGARN